MHHKSCVIFDLLPLLRWGVIAPSLLTSFHGRVCRQEIFIRTPLPRLSERISGRRYWGYNPSNWTNDYFGDPQFHPLTLNGELGALAEASVRAFTSRRMTA